MNPTQNISGKETIYTGKSSDFSNGQPDQCGKQIYISDSVPDYWQTFGLLRRFPRDAGRLPEVSDSLTDRSGKPSYISGSLPDWSG